MGLLSSLTKLANQNPLQRLTNEVASLNQKLQNAPQDLFSKGLRAIGLSSPTADQLSARFGDALRVGLSDKYFRDSTTEVNRVTREEICTNMFPKFAETTTQAVSRNDKAVGSIEGVNDKSILQFPRHIGKYYMAMKFREYTRTSPHEKANMVFKNAVVLPVPKGLVENFDLDVQTKSTGLAGGVADAAMAAGATDKSKLADFAKSQAGALAYSFAASKVDDTTASILGQAAGAIPNPHMSTFFNGVGMRTLRFEWTFAPRNVQESQDMMEIINTLKSNSLPTFSTTGTAALQYPYLCFIDLHPWAKDKGNELMKFKPALLKNVTINYSPNGIPSFFAGTNLPTFAQITLEMVETEYFTAHDFGRASHEDGIQKTIEKLAEIAGLDSDTLKADAAKMVTGEKVEEQVSDKAAKDDNAAGKSQDGAKAAAAPKTESPVNTATYQQQYKNSISGLGPSRVGPVTIRKPLSGPNQTTWSVSYNAGQKKYMVIKNAPGLPPAPYYADTQQEAYDVVARDGAFNQ